MEPSSFLSNIKLDRFTEQDYQHYTSSPRWIPDT